MAKTSLNEILQYLRPTVRLQGIAIDQFRIPSAVHKEAATVAQLRERFIKGCENISYSDRATKTEKITLYERLQSLGILEEVLGNSVVEEIGVVLEVFEIENRERKLQHKHRSSHGLPVQFHRSLLHAIFQHIQELRSLLHRYHVSEQRIALYLKAAHEQMLREVRAMLPIYPVRSDEYKPATMNRSSDDVIISIYDVFVEALRAAKVTRGRIELAKQLTRVVCPTSSAESISTKVRPSRRRKTRFSFWTVPSPKPTPR